MVVLVQWGLGLRRASFLSLVLGHGLPMSKHNQSQVLWKGRGGTNDFWIGAQLFSFISPSNLYQKPQKGELSYPRSDRSKGESWDLNPNNSCLKAMDDGGDWTRREISSKSACIIEILQGEWQWVSLAHISVIIFFEYKNNMCIEAI